MAKPKPRPTPPPPATPAALDKWVGTEGRRATKPPRHKGTKVAKADTKPHAMTLRLPGDLYRELAHTCIDRNTSMTAALLDGARLWLAKH